MPVFRGYVIVPKLINFTNFSTANNKLNWYTCKGPEYKTIVPLLFSRKEEKLWNQFHGTHYILWWTRYPFFSHLHTPPFSPHRDNFSHLFLL